MKEEPRAFSPSEDKRPVPWYGCLGRDNDCGGTTAVLAGLHN